jgi:hypothetical protein
MGERLETDRREPGVERTHREGVQHGRPEPAEVACEALSFEDADE